jgi:hypothetical protein
MNTKLDEHHRRLIFWDLHGGEGIATEEEVEGWIENRIDHDLQNLSDQKAESERKGQ